jgi:plasmid stabilization system protein ParE
MVVRWACAAIVEAEKKFRRVQGWRDTEKLVTALNDLEAKEEAAARARRLRSTIEPSLREDQQRAGQPRRPGSVREVELCRRSPCSPTHQTGL